MAGSNPEFARQMCYPLVYLDSSLLPADGKLHLKNALPAMDRLGIALIGHQTPKSPGSGKGYRWNYYIHTVVNTHPNRVYPCTKLKEDCVIW